MSEAPIHLKLAMVSRRAAFSGNTSLIVTLSSCYFFAKIPNLLCLRMIGDKSQNKNNTNQKSDITLAARRHIETVLVEVVTCEIKLF